MFTKGINVSNTNHWRRKHWATDKGKDRDSTGLQKLHFTCGGILEIKPFLKTEIWGRNSLTIIPGDHRPLCIHRLEQLSLISMAPTPHPLPSDLSINKYDSAVIAGVFCSSQIPASTPTALNSYLATLMVYIQRSKDICLEFKLSPQIHLVPNCVFYHIHLETNFKFFTGYKVELSLSFILGTQKPPFMLFLKCAVSFPCYCHPSSLFLCHSKCCLNDTSFPKISFPVFLSPAQSIVIILA